jgi:hypothetical protein
LLGRRSQGRQVVFYPDWARHRYGAPFKRNISYSKLLPIGVVVFPGSNMGVPAWRFAADGAA